MFQSHEQHPAEQDRKTSTASGNWKVFQSHEQHPAEQDRKTSTASGNWKVFQSALFPYRLTGRGLSPVWHARKRFAGFLCRIPSAK